MYWIGPRIDPWSTPFMCTFHKKSDLLCCLLCRWFKGIPDCFEGSFHIKSTGVGDTTLSQIGLIFFTYCWDICENRNPQFWVVNLLSQWTCCEDGNWWIYVICCAKSESAVRNVICITNSKIHNKKSLPYPIFDMVYEVAGLICYCTSLYLTNVWKSAKWFFLHWDIWHSSPWNNRYEILQTTFLREAYVIFINDIKFKTGPVTCHTWTGDKLTVYLSICSQKARGNLIIQDFFFLLFKFRARLCKMGVICFGFFLFILLCSAMGMILPWIVRMCLLFAADIFVQ